MTSKVTKTQKKLAESIKACLDNAQSFMRDAELLGNNGSYGHALSLAIMGLEEITKAFFFQKAYSGKIKLKDLQNYIHQHRAKQRGALRLHDAMDVRARIYDEKIKEKIVANKKLKFSKEELSSLNREVIEEIKKIDSSSYRGQKKLEKDRLKGFYVRTNNDGSLISTPSQGFGSEAAIAVAELFMALEISRDVLKALNVI